jgi:tryptophanyl-tRNA synthetase
MAPPTLLSGFRPTGRLHLGHLHGTLKNWVRLQATFRSFFFVADWHALTTSFEETGGIAQSTREMVADWLAVGLDPERSVIFRQSAILEHAELFLIFAMITPTPWLLRNPTVKEQARELGLVESDDESEMVKINFGHLGYPVLQAADILMYKANKVPVGADQVPHVEFTRELARRFNHLYRPVFTEPEALLSEAPKIAGLDGRKMSKSYGNAITLFAPREEQAKLVRRVVTDSRAPQEPKDPDSCTLVALLDTFADPAAAQEVRGRYRTGGIGYGDVKGLLAEQLHTTLAPMRDRYQALVADSARLDAALEAGERRANQRANETLRLMSTAMGL